MNNVAQYMVYVIFHPSLFYAVEFQRVTAQRCNPHACTVVRFPSRKMIALFPHMPHAAATLSLLAFSPPSLSCLLACHIDFFPSGLSFSPTV